MDSSRIGPDRLHGVLLLGRFQVNPGAPGSESQRPPGRPWPLGDNATTHLWWMGKDGDFNGEMEDELFHFSRFHFLNR